MKKLFLMCHCECLPSGQNQSVAILQTIFFYFIFGFFALSGIFLVMPKAHASSSDIVISEVMYDCSGSDTNCEWVEIFNPADPAAPSVDITNWKFSDGTNHGLNLNVGESKILISPGEYLVLASDRTAFLSTHTGFIGQVIDTVMSLNNTTDTISIINQSSIEVDSLTYLNSWGGNGNKRTLERNDFDLPNSALNWHESGVDGGTPGKDNSILSPPDVPDLISPLNKAVFVGNKSFDFVWNEDSGLTYKLIISENPDLSNPLDEGAELGWGKYFWAVSASANNLMELSEIWSFELKEPVYSKNIIINEILPHPENGSDNEFIELYNNGIESVDISGWFLDDAESGSISFMIPESTIIGPGQYLVFQKDQTKISLNDTGDMARLLFPNGKEISATSYGKASLGSAWARGPDDVWNWTTTPTPGGLNVFTKPVVEEKPQEVEETINTVPIEIQTGDHQNYFNKLVSITGEVISTSGDTFYLDDGSGEVKIYIQTKTGINKPEMHKGDIFQIIGIVDVYGQTWRILPQRQEDIQLIEPAAKVSTKKVTVKKVAAEVASVVKEPLIPKAVAAASTLAPAKNVKENSLLDQLAKTAIGLAILFLVFLIIKIMRRPQRKIVGGHFGDDET